MSCPSTTYATVYGDDWGRTAGSHPSRGSAAGCRRWRDHPARVLKGAKPADLPVMTPRSAWARLSSKRILASAPKSSHARPVA